LHARRKIVKRSMWVAVVYTVSLAILLSLRTAAAQSAKAEGLITGRSGDTMTIRTADSSSVVVFSPTLHKCPIQAPSRRGANRCRWPRSYRSPGQGGGLQRQNQLVQVVAFKGNDLEDAQMIQPDCNRRRSRYSRARRNWQRRRPRWRGNSRDAGTAAADEAAQEKIDAIKRPLKPPTSASASWTITTSSTK